MLSSTQSFSPAFSLTVDFLLVQYPLFGLEKIVRKFRSFEEADNADYDYYRRLSGNEKLQLLLDLIMPENADALLSSDLREFIHLLNPKNVRT